ALTRTAATSTSGWRAAADRASPKGGAPSSPSTSPPARRWPMRGGALRVASSPSGSTAHACTNWKSSACERKSPCCAWARNRSERAADQETGGDGGERQRDAADDISDRCSGLAAFPQRQCVEAEGGKGGEA